MISLFGKKDRSSFDEVRKKRKALRLKGIKNEINHLIHRRELVSEDLDNIDKQIEEKKELFEKIKSEHDEL